MPATTEYMPRERKPAGETRKDNSEPVRIDRHLMAIIRIVAPIAGMTAPQWIESRLAPIARKELDEVPARVAELKKRKAD